MQLRAIAVVAAAMYAGALLIATVWPKHSFLAAFTNVGLGLSTSGTAAGQVTVLSFPHFWPTDAWPFFADANATKSLFGDVRSSPLDFAAWTAYGTYANWRFPDLLYFQEFGLGTTGQVVQHVALVATGFAGLAWLIGQAGARRLDRSCRPRDRRVDQRARGAGRASSRAGSARSCRCWRSARHASPGASPAAARGAASTWPVRWR